jgi:predicted enzyme related to lactoylglutathione lyase
MTVGNRRPGDFCWINMLTPDLEKARGFFGEVLGWSTPEMPGLGYKVQVSGRDIGGMFDVVSPRTPNGTAPVIGVMVKVENADAMAAKVRELGGRAEDAWDVGPAGRMAVCHDPNGAQFDLWQPKQLQGTDVDTMVHGAASWFETITPDSARVCDFYSKLFGWKMKLTPVPNVSYTEAWLGEVPIGGIMQQTPEMAHMKPAWGTYFAVTDADKAARDAARLGGMVCVPVTPIPNVGRFCCLASPQGVVFSVIEYKQ